MIACFDVDYSDSRANVACLVFEDWSSEKEFRIYKKVIDEIEPYISGQFYKRELPCIIQTLKIIEETIDYIVVDSFVWLDSQIKNGLGAYLYYALDQKIPVVGVAKSMFNSATNYMPVYRGDSIKPLLVSSAGIELAKAAQLIENMNGDYRLPYLLKKVDSLCREWN